MTSAQKMSKYALAFRQAYNSAFATFLTTHASEGIDVPLMALAHDYAHHCATIQVGACKCDGNGAITVHAAEHRVGREIRTWQFAKCFACQGKGFQNSADQRRNWGYDNFYRKVEA